MIGICIGGWYWYWRLVVGGWWLVAGGCNMETKHSKQGVYRSMHNIASTHIQQIIHAKHSKPTKHSKQCANQHTKQSNAHLQQNKAQVFDCH